MNKKGFLRKQQDLSISTGVSGSLLGRIFTGRRLANFVEQLPYFFSGKVLRLLSTKPVVPKSCWSTFHYLYRLCQLLSFCLSVSNPPSSTSSNFVFWALDFKPYPCLLKEKYFLFPVCIVQAMLLHPTVTVPSCRSTCSCLDRVRLRKPFQRYQHSLSEAFQ